MLHTEVVHKILGNSNLEYGITEQRNNLTLHSKYYTIIYALLYSVYTLLTS